jgi:hypothetical protein
MACASSRAHTIGESRQFFTAIKVRMAHLGATMKPSRSAGSMHFEKVPT